MNGFFNAPLALPWQEPAERPPAVPVVVDLETLGTVAGSAVLSIGAVAYAGRRLVGYYSVIDLGSCLDAGLLIDRDTLRWWWDQEATSRTEAFGGTEPLAAALARFARWLEREAGPERRIYGCGPSFDCAILGAAYDAVRQPRPWRYSRERCVRTVLDEAHRRSSPARRIESRQPHHAFWDALAEMESVLNVWQVVPDDMALDRIPVEVAKREARPDPR